MVPFVAGGTTDTIARLIAQRLRPMGPACHRQQPPRRRQHDRHRRSSPRPRPTVTRCSSPPSRSPINASLQKQPFDAVKDFAPITEIASIPLMLVVHNSLPVNTVKEFIEYSKAQPAGLDYATSGAGTSTHLAAEMFKHHDRRQARARAVQGQRRGDERAARRPREGAFRADAPRALQHVRSGALRVLAVTTEKRLPELPDVPTIAELGYPGYEISSWQGVFAPAGTPKDIIDKLNGEIVAMLKHARGAGADQARRRDAGRQFARAMVKRFRDEVAKWAKVAKSAGLATATEPRADSRGP